MPTKDVEACSGLLRSESMTKYDVVMQRDACHFILYHLGRIGKAHFIDLRAGDTAFMRPFTASIRRCDDLERRLKLILEQMKACGIEPHTDLPGEMNTSGHSLDVLENAIDKKEEELRQINRALESLQNQTNRLREMYEISIRDVSSESRSGAYMLIGTIPTLVVDNFARMSYRISRGNVFLRTDTISEDFEEPSGQKIKKSFIVVYTPSNRLLPKLKKIGEGLGGSFMEPSELTQDGQNETAESWQARRQSVESTITRTKAQRNSILYSMAESISHWFITVVSEKGIYSIMNMLDTSGSIAKAQVWVPDADFDEFVAALEHGCQAAGESIAPIVTKAMTQTRPPTFFRTNKYTEVFQGIVDSYGIARYKEVNPGVFTIVTFPYLFGIMFGDIGHGVLLTFFAGALILLEHKFLGKRLNEMFAMIFAGRYLIFGMGLMAIYMGMLYNDFFGFSVQLFETKYKWPALPPHGPSGTVQPSYPNARPSIKPDSPYVFGIDVAWSETTNKLEFYNGVKMKSAVVVGVVQMLLGIFLSLLNYLREKDYRHVFFKFIPEVIFLVCTFGYMSFLICFKWCYPFENTNLAPSLLQTMTDFFLSPGSVKMPLYAGQGAVQAILLLLAFAQVPIMLLTVPLLKCREARAKAAKASDPEYQNIAATEAGHDDHDGHGEFAFGEVMIHYAIHTIEFVLGCVSNTASYLRLWALSLAHAELSEVFLDFALLKGFDYDSGNGIFLMVATGVWLGVTIAVLLMMESLSAFLHALRLHWVEFQNKFYHGDGHQFLPFELMGERD